MPRRNAKGGKGGGVRSADTHGSGGAAGQQMAMSKMGVGMMMVLLLGAGEICVQEVSARWSVLREGRGCGGAWGGEWAGLSAQRQRRTARSDG